MSSLYLGLFVRLVVIAIIFPLLTKNYLDVIVAPITDLFGGLLIGVITLVVPSRRNRIDFMKQLNWSTIVIAIILLIGQI